MAGGRLLLSLNVALYRGLAFKKTYMKLFYFLVIKNLGLASDPDLAKWQDLDGRIQ